MGVLMGLILMTIDACAILLRGSPLRRAARGWRKQLPNLGRLRKNQAPPVFSMQLYFAHLNGMSVDDLSRETKLPKEWIEERLEAARECVEFELPSGDSTATSPNSRLH
jgi:hypothetical protein